MYFCENKSLSMPTLRMTSEAKVLGSSINVGIYLILADEKG